MPAPAQQHQAQPDGDRVAGRRLLDETPADPTRQWPEIKGLHDIFEARNVWVGGATGSWWLHQSAHAPDEGALHRVVVEYAAGLPAEAIVEFRQAIGLDPDVADYHYNLGIALGHAGKAGEAAAEYRQALRLRPDLAEARRALERLGENREP